MNGAVKIQEVLSNHKLWIDGLGGERADLSDADLSGADLRSANLHGANLRFANLRHARLNGTDLRNADLSNADLRRASLQGADLRAADLYDAYLRAANLRFAYLRFADLRGADLSGADLSGADLSGADLSGANLHDADLSGTDLRSADLRGTNLRGVNLRRADLSGAIGLITSIQYLRDNFERTSEGYIAYKTFGTFYPAPERWELKPGSVITETCNYDRTDDCGCGVNVGTLAWVKTNTTGHMWKLLIRWEWLADVCVPYSTDGKIRCGQAEIVGRVER